MEPRPRPPTALLVRRAASCGSSDGDTVAVDNGSVAEQPDPPVGLQNLAFDDAQFDGQFLRALDAIPNGGADVGECFVTARRIPSGSRPVDPQLLESYRRQRDSFQRAAKLGDYAFDITKIPYAATSLEGYWLRPDGAGPFPTVVMVGGYDGTKEECYFSTGRAALRRGYAVLLVDGPGQGGPLIEQGLVFRPDWEAVVSPQIDWLLARPEVDPKRIALVGRSWGGFLAPRAATAEHRIAALVADAPQYAPAKGAAGLLPEQYRNQVKTGDAAELNAVLEEQMTNSPYLSWVFNRGMLTHGFDTPIDYLRGLEPYTLEGIAEKLCTAESDARGNDAQPLYDAITAPKEYLKFTNAEGAGEHDEAGAAALFEQRVFDWLDARMAEIH